MKETAEYLIYLKQRRGISGKMCKFALTKVRTQTITAA